MMELSIFELIISQTSNHVGRHGEWEGEQIRNPHNELPHASDWDYHHFQCRMTSEGDQSTQLRSGAMHGETKVNSNAQHLTQRFRTQSNPGLCTCVGSLDSGISRIDGGRGWSCLVPQ